MRTFIVRCFVIFCVLFVLPGTPLACMHVITTGYEARCEKSNPDMHMQTLKKLGVLPQEAVMVGDELLVDIRIPRKLGMHTIQLDRSRKARKSSEADAIVRTLTEAVGRIEKWQKSWS